MEIDAFDAVRPRKEFSLTRGVLSNECFEG
jgi:hypothetical protein